jgi:MFS family permease
MSATADAADFAPEKAMPVRHVAAAVIGNALSFYDFLTFSYFSIQIGHAFFPSKDPSVSLLSSLAVFGVGFMSRPIGSIVIGTMGDRVGRKPAMILSFALLGVGIVGLALTPSYAAIGVAAPMLAVLFRLIQGFALGGEVGPTTAFLIEGAPLAQRGFYGSFQYATQDFAILVAGLVGVTLSHLLPPAFFDANGWRIAFLIGALIIPFGLVIRRSLPETHDPLADAVHEDRSTPRSYLWLAFLGFGLLASGTISSYVTGYMTTYANDTLHLPVELAFWATVVNGAAGLAFDNLSGWFSDRVGRKPIMITTWIIYAAVAVPAFHMMATLRSGEALLGATALLSALGAFGSVPCIVAITEALPRRVRSGALAIVYAFAISIFGGSAQFVVKKLIDLTGDPLAPGWYLTAALLVGLAAMIAMPETAPVKVKR